MGIPNLLRFLKPYIQPVHIKKYSGKRVGIDAYSWLHKGAYSCSMELCLNKQGESARRYLRYFMHRIDLLRHHNITPVVVFDGANIPSKSSTEESRRQNRQENLLLAKGKLKEGNATAAIEYFQRAVWISPDMAYQLILILKAENIEFVVAPYEADAQLAYLSCIESHDGGISAIITEDSDLIAYGCPTIIFKMDRHGHGDEIVMDKVFSSSRNNLSFQHFDMELFTGMCVLAGCDFLSSIPGIGIKRAYSLVSKHRNIERALSALTVEKASLMPEDYCVSFQKAIAIFNHARIYDVKSQRVKPMKPLPESLLLAVDGDLDFLGPYLFHPSLSKLALQFLAELLFLEITQLLKNIQVYVVLDYHYTREIPPSIAIAIAEGHFNPITMEAFDQSGSSSAYKHFDESSIILEIIPKKETSLSIFSVEEMTEEEKTIEQTGVVLNSTKYIHDAFALRKLSEPKAFYHSESEKVIERGDIPNNNPFKRKKIEVNSTETVDLHDQRVADVTAVDLIDEIASVPSVEKIDVDPRGLSGASKQKLNAKNKCQAVGRGKNGILRFFARV